MKRIDHDHANMREAIEHAIDAEPAASVGICGALAVYWYQRGQLTDARGWIGRALEVGEGADAANLARAYLQLSAIERQQNAAEAAESHCERALELYREADDRDGIARSLSQLGAIVERRGEFDLAAELLTEALTLLHEGDDKERTAFALNALGVVEHVRGGWTRRGRATRRVSHWAARSATRTPLRRRSSISER